MAFLCSGPNHADQYVFCVCAVEYGEGRINMSGRGLVYSITKKCHVPGLSILIGRQCMYTNH